MGRRFRTYVLPGIIFQSVLIGGAYGTGREIVEYGARFGTSGLASILAIFAGFTAVAAVAFEFARVHRVYDYRAFMRQLIGPLWPLFDALFLVLVVVIIAVVSAAAGSVVRSVLGWPEWLGFSVVVLAVGLLNAFGRAAIERYKTAGTILLYAGYAVFAGVTLKATGGDLARNLSSTESSTATLASAVGAGVLYVGYNLAALLTTFFVLDRHTERRHAVGAAVVTGLLATLPFLLTYLAFMGSYPEAEVLDAPVPWLVLLERHGGSGVLVLFALVLLWTLVETSTGLIHAVTDRVSAALSDAGRNPLSPWQAGAITFSLLLGAALLSRVGLIDLVARGYSALAYGFLALFALPLLTRGVAMILRR